GRSACALAGGCALGRRGLRRRHRMLGFTDDVDVLRRPRQADVGPAAGQARALGLVGVGDEDGHARPTAEWDDDLRGGPEIHRALDEALYLRPAVAGGRVLRVELQL